MTSQNQNVLDTLAAKYPDAIVTHTEFRDELTLEITRDGIVEVCRFLRDDPGMAFNLLADLCGIDMYTPTKRFGVIYNLYSFKTNHRIRLKTFVEEEDPKVPTMTVVWGTANWHERETFDMFGIEFEDFPLMGIPGSLELPKK
jgi:NADH-quinone oxidoreductase subunit C